ncbi:DNA repair and recombination protein RDH54 [Wickerhamiella sorbophila]|uniref:DNA repair and recombination protein RDH54 n=1 Tax=Wickerhamiella sorbophila TaxID=45607 RepID=A0A2T0FFA1_9ASCO|nr:DNA repair and recombination protein RDH54 [Wickerhamiella sorbophila]PRT53650.1 DNA repair and recombination protein RDH54 [Wickerhamiella sorbophila]
MNRAFTPLKPLQRNGVLANSMPDVQTKKATFQAMWRKKSGKKNKTWEGDAIATLSGGNLVVKSGNKQLLRVSCANASEGDLFAGGVYECELGSMLDVEIKSSPVVEEPLIPRKKIALTRQKSVSLNDLLSAPLPKVGSAAPAVPKNPVSKPSTNVAARPVVKKPVAMTNISSGELEIDTELLEHLRPHQVEAVQFLYKCVIGKAHSYGNGALLADEMGLGKTLTSIALIFSLLKSGLIKNCLVVCPVTLLRNWKAEFKKWLGETRIGVFVASPEADVSNFFKTHFKTYQVLIAGYERMIKIADELAGGMQLFDLVICDEGHRLKGLKTKAAQSITSVSGDKRVILTGTPVQNNLSEFYALADYLNPGIFGSMAKFVKKFSDPIALSRSPEASESSVQNGQEATEELIEIVSSFVLRRDFRILEKYIQVPKTELVVFCKPVPNQIHSYKNIIASNVISNCLDTSNQGELLKAISLLRKAATSTFLVPEEWRLGRTLTTSESGGKLQVLASLMKELSSKTDEKIVIVSGFTSTLDLVQTMCANLELQWLRLDGSTPQDQRQNLVDLFNKTNHKRSFAFMLSARSGGAGLNLIGASRLVLLDSDWNPAIDLQAMARIFRDGQTRHVHIYRFLTTGTIDEKIFQRQLTKQGLSDTVLDLEPTPDKFSKDQLRDLFSLRTPQLCCTVEEGPHEHLEVVQATDGGLLESAAANISCVLKVKQ